MDQDLFIDIPVKSHGCLCPFHPMQIASYFLFSFHAYVFYFVELVSLQQLGRAVYVLVAPYTLLFLSVISLGIVITLSDPTDPTVYSERLRLQRKICKTHVLDRTKHCGVCNRCVDSFDHHCNWLNNCIGRQNYGRFIVLLFLLLAFSTFQSALNLWVLASLHRGEYAEPIAQFYGLGEGPARALGYVLTLVCFCVQAACVAFVLQLLFLHRWLNQKGITTFEYVLFLREKMDNPSLKLEGQFMKGQHKSKVLVRVDQNADKDKPKEKDSAREECLPARPRVLSGTSDEQVKTASNLPVKDNASENEGTRSPFPLDSERPTQQPPSLVESLANFMRCDKSAAKTVPEPVGSRADVPPRGFVGPDMLKKIAGWSSPEEISAPSKDREVKSPPNGINKEAEKKADDGGDKAVRCDRTYENEQLAWVNGAKPKKRVGKRFSISKVVAEQLELEDHSIRAEQGENDDKLLSVKRSETDPSIAAQKIEQVSKI